MLDRYSDSNNANDLRSELAEKLDEKNREMEQLVYVTSHDLRSPLVNVNGFSNELELSRRELLELMEQATLPDEMRMKVLTILNDDMPQSLAYIRSSADKMNSLINALLQLSRTGRNVLELSNLDMNSVLSDVKNSFEYLARETGAVVNVSDLPSCFSDRESVNQLFSNLISNALKFLDPARPGVIDVSGEIDGNRVIYCIEDNGVGIKPEHLTKIFEVFYRVDPEKAEGYGIGMSIVKKILYRLGGDVRVESNLGVGSKFFVSLPLEDFS